MFLLLYRNATDKQIKWLCRNALTIAPACWIHNTQIPGTIPITASKAVCSNLRDEIDLASYKCLNEIESWIKDNNFKGLQKRLAVNKLETIGSVSMDMEVIEHAKDLIIILNGSEEKSTNSETKIEKDDSLGVDKKTVEDYFLRLSKEPTIH